MHPDQKPKQYRNSVVTYSIKTLKMVHIKKKNLKKKKYHCKNYTGIYDKKKKDLGNYE